MEAHQKGLYSPLFEHDGCGIGAVVSIKGIKTHKSVDNALKIVERLAHRAGKDATGDTGDGVSILTQIPHALFKEAVACIAGLEEGEYGVGMFFFPQDMTLRNRAKKTMETIAEKECLHFLGWRDVPTQSEVLGTRAYACIPYICQGFFARPKQLASDIEFDRCLYVTRRVFEQSNDNTYVCSFSSRTIVYKGMFLVHQLRNFYLDLLDERYTSALAMVHSRFSTNTTPSWERTHPNRLILHNGEINTMCGNVDRMYGREESMHPSLLKDEIDKILPAINGEGSDSAMLDNTLEFLMMNGMELPKAVMITIPEPWQHERDIAREKRDLYHYYATMMEPWDGPTAILFSDGDMVGTTLDHNGLRPVRYYITDDDYLILASEVGVLDIPAEKNNGEIRADPRAHAAGGYQGRVCNR